MIAEIQVTNALPPGLIFFGQRFRVTEHVLTKEGQNTKVTLFYMVPPAESYAMLRLTELTPSAVDDMG